MTVWVLQLALTPEEEAHILERPRLPLPLGDVPDLSSLRGEGDCRRLMQRLHPDDPPETIARKSERVWRLYAGVNREDVIAVPLPLRREVALAEVSGPYEYQTVDGKDIHLIPVRWHPKFFSMASFGKHAELFALTTPAMNEVGQPQARIAIRDRLPHRSTSFARWKWLFVGLMGLMGLARLLERLAHMGSM